ncbi:MAG: hypothetical protein GWO02_07370 [Gammaproteobacteria bacterium]|nr:hypothetical protein [Gammaproteobacteria bacterium]
MLAPRIPFTRLLFAVVAIDQLTKSLAPALLAQGRELILPGTGLTLVSAPVSNVPAYSARLLIFTLLVVLLLVRLLRRDEQAGELAFSGIQLVVGGALSTAIDIFLLREKVAVFALAAGGAEVYVSVANAAVVVGALLLVLDFMQRRWVPVGPEVPLLDPPRWSVDLGQLRRGIDNVRIDVRLSPRFEGAARDLITSLLTVQVWRDPWSTTPPQPSQRTLEGFRTGYAQLVEAAIHRAKQDNESTRVALAQLAAIKFVLGETREEFDRLLRERRTALDFSADPAGRKGAHAHEQFVRLRRRRRAIIDATVAATFQQMQHAENGPIADLKSSLLGEPAGLPPEVFASPLLRAEDLGDEQVLMRHYVLLGQRADDAFNPRRLEHLMREFFAPYPLTGPDPDASAADATPAARESDRARSSRGRGLWPWFDEPDNADVLLDIDGYRSERRRAKARGDRDAARRFTRHVRFQRRLAGRLDKTLRAEGVIPFILSAYEVPALWKTLQIPLNPHAIHRYLSGPRGRSEVAVKLRALARSTGRVNVIEELDGAARRLRRASYRHRRAFAQRFMRDFMTYRRDLARARIIGRWLEELRLLKAPDEIRLSQANRMLYELLTVEDGQAEAAPPVCGHTIIKADVRGSTRIAQELIDRGLNPGTHFGLNFFEPIKSLIDLYGAEKVFIEGDAIILALLERDDEGAARVSVARACGLARSILEVVSAHNATGAKYGLPALELGIGIAHEAGPPTYLFDEDQPIMISPAIGRADRLSSCAPFLRKKHQPKSGRRIQVYSTDTLSLYDAKGTSLFRYNVNGIELESAAFEKLTGELKLEVLDDPDSTTGGRFFAARYPDARGMMRNLLVREGSVKPIGRLQDPEAVEVQRFYEVVVDPEVLGRVARESSDARGDPDPGR